MTEVNSPEEDVVDIAPDKLGRLPLPRLQLTWEKIDDHDWLVRYELIMPVDRYDIRDGEDAGADGRKGYIAAKMSGGTKVGRGSRSPIERDGVLDAPFRDGAHAQWDAITLGIPAFVVYGDTYRRLGGDPDLWQHPPPHFWRERA